jgi:hypothetical protein
MHCSYRLDTHKYARAEKSEWPFAPFSFFQKRKIKIRLCPSLLFRPQSWTNEWPALGKTLNRFFHPHLVWIHSTSFRCCCSLGLLWGRRRPNGLFLSVHAGGKKKWPYWCSSQLYRLLCLDWQREMSKIRAEQCVECSLLKGIAGSRPGQKRVFSISDFKHLDTWTLRWW